MGVMTSYGSYNNKDSPVISNSLIISITNSTISFVSGLVVWSIIGYLEYIDSSVKDKKNSIGLAFIAYPTATSKMEGATIWSITFFATIFLLGIDSAFSMIEAGSTVIHDQVGKKMERWMIAGVLCFFGAIISGFFCLDIGIYLFDNVDHFLSNYVMLTLGIFECVGISWFYKNYSTM